MRIFRLSDPAMNRLSQTLLPTLKESQLPLLRSGEQHAKSTRLLLRAGFISQVH